MTAWKLKMAVDSVLEKTLKDHLKDEDIRDDLTEEIGSAAFDQKTIGKIGRQLRKKMEEDVKKQVEEIIRDDQIAENLTDLKQVIVASEQKWGTDRIAWRPTGNPDHDSFDHIRPLLIQHLLRLQDDERSLHADADRRLRSIEDARKQLLLRLNSLPEM